MLTCSNATKMIGSILSGSRLRGWAASAARGPTDAREALSKTTKLGDPFMPGPRLRVWHSPASPVQQGVLQNEKWGWSYIVT